MSRLKVLIAVLAIVGFAVSCVVVVRVQSDESRPPPVSTVSSPDIVLPPFSLPRPGQKAVFFGDSWVEGVDAQPRTQGFAFQVGRALGVDYEVYGSGGTGYVNPGNAVAYPERMQRLAIDPSVSLVVIEGGVNDLNDMTGLSTAVQRTVQAARGKFRNAAVVVFGVMPLTADLSGLREISSRIGYVAVRNGAYFVSPVAERWLNSSNVNGFLDPRSNHPTTAGHALLARLVLASLQRVAAQGMTVRT